MTKKNRWIKQRKYLKLYKINWKECEDIYVGQTNYLEKIIYAQKNDYKFLEKFSSIIKLM